MQIHHLTPAEEQLMQLFWKMKSFYLKDVMEQHREPKPHQNTVSTYLKILVEKKFLTAEKEGRIFRYTIAISFENYRNFLLKNLILNYFGNSPAELIKAMMDEKLLNSSILSQFFEIKTTVIPVKEVTEKENPVAELIRELTQPKKKKKNKKKGKKKKD